MTDKVFDSRVKITDQALEYTLSKIKVGMTEREVEVLLKNKMI